MQELDLWLFSQPPSLRAQAWMSLRHAIPKSGWTKWQWIWPLSLLRLTGHPPFLHARVPGDTQLCKGDPKEHHSLPWDLHLDPSMPSSQDATLTKAADLRSLPMRHSTEPSGDLGTPRLWHSWLERLWGTLTVMWIWSGIPAVYLPVLIPRDPSKVSDVVQSLSSVRLFATSWTAALQASLAFTPRVCSDSCPLNQWCHATISSFVAPFSPCTQIFPSIRVFSNGSALRIRWPKHWSFSTSPSNKYSGLIPLGLTGWIFPAVQGTLKSLLQHHSLKTSTLWCWTFFMVQLSHPYMTTGKLTALTIWTLVSKVMSLLFKSLSRFVIAFCPRSKCLLIWWLQSFSALILESKK